MFSKRSWIGHLIVLGMYGVIAIALSYPLLLHFGDTIPGVQGDVWSYLWAMGWARVSTLDLRINPFRNDFIFYPLGGATQLMWSSALPSFMSVPLQLAFGLVPAFNITYLASTVLTGYGTFLLARYVLLKSAAKRIQGMCSNSTQERERAGSAITFSAIFAGLAFAFCALRSGYGLAFTNLYHTELIPFFILFLLRTQFELQWRDPLFAGIILGLNVYIDFQIAAFLLIFTAIWFIIAFVGEIRKSGAAHLPPSSFQLLPKAEKMNYGRPAHIVARLTVIALVSLITVAPMIAIVGQDLRAEGGNYIRVYALKYSAARSYDLLSFFLPNARSSLYRLLPAPQVAGVNASVNVDGESQFSPDRQAFLGIVTMGLALIGALRFPRPLMLWIITSLVFALISLGPTLHLAGTDIGIPLPYAVLHELPIANNIRIPMRYGLIAFLAVAILASNGLWAIASRWRGTLPPLVLSAIMLAEAAVVPYPTLDLTVPRVYESIASQPGDFSVLEIPTFNWRAASAIEVYQVFHHKRILRAYTNRIAPDLADYFSLRQSPIIVKSLRILEGEEEGPLSDVDVAADRKSAPAVIRFFGLRFAILHHEWLDPEAATNLDRYLRDVLGARVFVQEGSITAYEFDQPPLPGPDLSLPLDNDQALMYLGRGWQTEPLAQVAGGSGRFVTLTSSQVFFRSADCRCLRPMLQFRAYSEISLDMLKFEFNGHDAGAVALKQGWADYALPLPTGSVQGGLDLLTLVHSPPDKNHIAFGKLELQKYE